MLCGSRPPLDAWGACLQADAALVDDASLQSWKPGPGRDAIIMAETSTQGLPFHSDSGSYRLLILELPAPLGLGPVEPVRFLYREGGLSRSYEARAASGSVVVEGLGGGSVTLAVDLLTTDPEIGSGTRALVGKVRAAGPCE